MIPMIPDSSIIAVSLALFFIGLAGVMARRNLLFILIGVEIMLNGVAVLLIAAGAKWGQAQGQIMFFFLLVMAGVEVGIGLALFLRIHRAHSTLNADELQEMKG